MVVRMTASELKAKLLGALDAVSQGDEIEVTKHGRVVARLVAARGPSVLRGSLTGLAATSAGVDDDDLFTTGETWDLT